MPMAPLFVYKGQGLRLAIWPTRVDIEQAGTLTRLPLRTIARVERAARCDELMLTTVDGQMYTYVLPPEQVEIVQYVLAQALDQPWLAPAP